MGYRDNAWHLLMATLIQKVDFKLRVIDGAAVNQHEILLNIHTYGSGWNYIAAVRVRELKPGAEWGPQTVRTFKGRDGVSVSGVPCSAEEALIQAKAYLCDTYTNIISQHIVLNDGHWPVHSDKLSEVCIADWIDARAIHKDNANRTNSGKTKEQEYNALFDGLGESW